MLRQYGISSPSKSRNCPVISLVALPASLPILSATWSTVRGACVSQDMESRLHDFTISYRATAGISHISLNMARTNRQKDHLEINADMTIMPVKYFALLFISQMKDFDHILNRKVRSTSGMSREKHLMSWFKADFEQRYDVAM